MKSTGMIFNAEMVNAILEGRKTQTRRMVKPQPIEDSTCCYHPKVKTSICPFGKVGDRIWVRETFHSFTDALTMETCTVYRATDGFDCKWTPAIHMPKVRSRITLEITSVRCERLHNITWQDAMAEGIGEFGEWSGNEDVTTPVGGFEELWYSIYGNWDDNPWVWVVEFKVLEVVK